MGIAIHIIDDDDAVRDSARALLEIHGFDVCVHASAEDFLRRSAEKADCLIVDFKMSGMTGLELLEHLRARGDATPALLVTSDGNSVIEKRAARLGVKLLPKPFEEKLLVNLIEQSCSTRG